MSLPPPAYTVQLGVPEELWELWKHHAAELCQRNGNDPKFPHGGHDIKNNPQLLNTLEDMARRYLPMCVYKFRLLDKQVKLNDLLLSDEDYDMVEETKSLKAVEDAITEFDERFLRVNAAFTRQLFAEGSGLEEEARREALDSKQARRGLAIALLAPVIKYCVAAGCEYSGYNAQLATHPTLVAALKGFVPRNIGDGKTL